MSKILIRNVTKVLSPLGFIKSETTWRRNNAVGFDVVNLQLAPFSSGVSINIGVYFKGMGQDTNPIAGKCHIRQCLQGGIERFAVEFDDSDSQVGQVIEAIVTTGLPWLAAVKTESGLKAEIARQADATSPALLEAMQYGVVRLG